MKLLKWMCGLPVMCLLLTAAPAAVFAGETMTGQGAVSDVNVHNILLHVGLVLAIMAVLITFFIIVGKKREEREEQERE